MSIGVTVLGSTGSIGLSTMDVIARHPDKFHAVALTANRQVDRMLEQCQQFKPQYAVMVDEQAADNLQRALQQAGLTDVQVLQGVEGLEQVAALEQIQYVMAAIVGAAGLRPALAAAKEGKRVLLANKEALVMSGHLFMQEVSENKAELLPIDSEHNAIFQCMPNGGQGDMRSDGVEKILLTASGGPFRKTSLSDLENVTPAQAVAHPNWDMGQKISVDSASMMNKGLEVIEARWLFDATPDQIQVVVHPQSVIHSMVQYADGSVLAQMGNPDMRTPIAHAMSWPDRISSGVAHLDLFEIAQLDFEKPDMERFPCLRLAYDALNAGGSHSCVLNAANEVAVDAFLQQQIRFTVIPAVIEKTMQQLPAVEATSIQQILEIDQAAREIALTEIKAAL